LPNLIVERGREKGQSIELAAGNTIVVGRDPASAQVVIADPASSRRHFQLSSRNGKWYVADLGSKNFTFLNEEKIDREVELANGDRIQVGETVFTYNDESKAEDKAAGLSGREIGGFRILERIGRGGMGTVYKAKQVSLNRLVALKFLSPKLSKDPAFVEKFFAEARAAAQLNHPNVVQVFDVGTLGGVQFFSMEFMEGGCVQDLLSAREDSRLPWQEALPLIVDATRGLVFAEKRGIIHRDIKPDNLMLTSEQKVKIGDLGLATSAEGGGEKGIFGTPHFIAPEQAQGKEVTHAADLYSLGATIYRIVTGRTPFTGNTVKEILRAQINDAPAPIAQTVPDFPPELTAIIDKLMAKKVEDRYQSATKLLEDLEAFELAHHIEMAGGVKSRKPFLVAMGALGVALVGVIVWAKTRPKEVDVQTVYKPGSVIRIGTTGPVRSPEEIQKEYDDAAEKAYLYIKLREAPLGDISLEKRPEWDQIQKDYDALREAHPKAQKHIDEAESRAKEIRTELDRLQELQQTVVKAATEWWTKLKGDLDAARGDARWGDAVRGAGAALAGEELKKHRPYLPADALPALQSVSEACIGEIQRKHAEVMQEAERLLAADKVGDALKSVEDWEKKVRDQGIDDGRVSLLADQAKGWRNDRAEAAQAKLRELLQADRDVYIDAYRAIRHLAADANDAGGPVFGYRFGEAATALRTSVEGRVKTWLYRDRAAAKAAQLDAMQAAWDTFAKLVADKRIWAPGEEIKGVPGMDKGAKVTIDPDKPATPAEVYLVVSISGGNTKRKVQWDDLTPAELFKTFIGPRINDRIPPELALQLASVFAELAAGDEAGMLLDRAKAPYEQTAWALSEVRAIQEYARIASRVDVAPSEVIRAVDTWRKTYHRSDFAVLVDGRPAADMAHLFADEEIDRFVDGWGEKK
jgi:serine/threonine-protein kinase